MRASENFINSTIMKIIVSTTLLFKILDKSNQTTRKMHRNCEVLLLIQNWVRKFTSSGPQKLWYENWVIEEYSKCLVRV